MFLSTFGSVTLEMDDGNGKEEKRDISEEVFTITLVVLASFEKGFNAPNE